MINMDNQSMGIHVQTNNVGDLMQQTVQPTGQTGPAKKKRKRCGECEGCSKKNNCLECGPCKSTRSHQICKMRKCEKLKTKKEKQREVSFRFFGLLFSFELLMYPKHKLLNTIQMIQIYSIFNAIFRLIFYRQYNIMKLIQ